MSRTTCAGTILSSMLAIAIVMSLFVGVAAGQSGGGATTVVGENETVDSINGIYGTIIVEGTVTGDVSGVAGDVIVREGGTVEGKLDVAAGNIRIAGTVEGNVSAAAGSVYLTETGVVNGSFDVGAGDVRVDGTIGGDAEIGADTIRLGDSAAIAGSLRYDGSLEGNRDAVAGDITEDSSIGANRVTDIQPFATMAVMFYTFLFNLLLGVVLLGLFPDFSDRLASRVRDDPGKTGLIGLGTVVGIPIFLVVIAITIIGIPIAFVGLFAFLLISWIALVYGRYAVGSWLLTYTDVTNRWAALVVGLFLALALWQIPIVGGLLNFVIYLLGLGALALGLFTRLRQLYSGEEQAPAAGTPAD